MTKYIMLAVDGILTGEVKDQPPSNNDLLIDITEDNKYCVLDYGIAIVKQLHELTRRGYSLVFHSDKEESFQLGVLEKLRLACIEANITFPHIVAMGVYDFKQYPTVSSDNPAIRVDKDGLIIVYWGADNATHKVSVRRALEKILKIDPTERANHWVIDTDEQVIATARKEAYLAPRFGNERVSLHSIIKSLLTVESAYSSVNKHRFYKIPLEHAEPLIALNLAEKKDLEETKSLEDKKELTCCRVL